MRYENVCLESIGYSIPDEVLTSTEIEQRLSPTYERLRVSAGRLELMTGIRERRVWPHGMLPSQQSIVSAQRALAAAGFDRSRIGALVHGSVCRDYLEPATACGVHRALELPTGALLYDVSNACLGLLDGIVHVANMIELGQIEAGLVVGTESSRALLDTTIEQLNADALLSRDQLKLAMASLTIGSASAAALLVDRRISRTKNRLHTAVARAETRFHELCQSARDESVAGGMRPIMQTDSETLMHEGVRVAEACFAEFLEAATWKRSQIARTFCHQVGSAHRKLLFEKLGLPSNIDDSTVEFLGNTGSAAVLVTAAVGTQRRAIKAGDQVALLGIGSGINALMLGLDCEGELPVGS